MDLARDPGYDLGRLVSGFLLKDAVRAVAEALPLVTWANSRGVTSRLDYLFFPAAVPM